MAIHFFYSTVLFLAECWQAVFEKHPLILSAKLLLYFVIQCRAWPTSLAFIVSRFIYLVDDMMSSDW